MFDDWTLTPFLADDPAFFLNANFPLPLDCSRSVANRSSISLSCFESNNSDQLLFGLTPDTDLTLSKTRRSYDGSSFETPLSFLRILCMSSDNLRCSFSVWLVEERLSRRWETPKVSKVRCCIQGKKEYDHHLYESFGIQCKTLGKMMLWLLPLL